MKRWLKIAAPLGVAALAVSVLAIGFGSPSGEAETLSCAGGALASQTEAATNTFESEIIYDGAATPAGDTHSFRFCGEDTMYLVGFVSWNGKKDLKVTLDAPDGSSYVFDSYSTVSSEYILLWGPLAHGDWQMTVTVKDKGTAHYHVTMQFR